MRAFLAAFFLLFLAAEAAADTIIMRSGEEKKGKVISKTASQVTFRQDVDGRAIEIPRSEISIIDAGAASTSVKKGFVSFFTQAPKKAAPATPAQAQAALNSTPVAAGAAGVVQHIKNMMNATNDAKRVVAQANENTQKRNEQNEALNKFLQEQK